MLFKSVEVVRQINVDHKVRYFILNCPGESSAYLVCCCCGEVTPLAPAAKDLQRTREAAAFGYVGVEETVELRGLCPRCQTNPGVAVLSSKLPVR